MSSLLVSVERSHPHLFRPTPCSGTSSGSAEERDSNISSSSAVLFQETNCFSENVKYLDGTTGVLNNISREIGNGISAPNQTSDHLFKNGDVLSIYQGNHYVFSQKSLMEYNLAPGRGQHFTTMPTSASGKSVEKVFISDIAKSNG